MSTLSPTACPWPGLEAVATGKHELKVGERIFRQGDRVIHRRNNYDLNVFNGDIGRVVATDAAEMTCEVAFASGGGPPGGNLPGVPAHLRPG